MMTATNTTATATETAPAPVTITKDDNDDSAGPLLDAIPVIDMSQPDESAIVQQLHDALTTIGFCTLIHHGVSPPLRQKAFKASKAFFDLPLDIKLKYKYRNQASNRGYIAYGAESHQSYTNDDTNQQKEHLLPQDKKETMDIGWDDEVGYENVWPSNDVLDETVYKNVLLEYFDTMDALQLRLIRYVGMGLGGLEATEIEDLVQKCSGKHENLRLLHYPALAQPSMRGNPHTDFGTLTLLVQDDVGGLKVKRKDGSWLFVEPVENSIIVNVGDMFMRWTNNTLKATIHQVETPPHLAATGGPIPERYSIAFFCNANKDVDLECLPGCSHPETNPVKYPTMNAHEYITSRLVATIDSK